MAVTRYYLRNTQTNGGTGGTVYDFSATQGTPATLQSASISGTSFTEVFRWQLDVTGNPPDAVIPVSVNISAVSAATLEVRWRVQRLNSSNAVQDSSGYSTAYNTTGTKTDNLTLTTSWASGDRLALSMELRRTGGGGSRTVTISVNNTASYIDPDLIPAAQTLTPDLFTNSQTFYGPTLAASYGLTPALYTNTQTFYSPTVTQPSGVQDLTPDLYTNTQTFYVPTVSATNELTPALYDNTQTFFSATVSQTGGGQALTPDLYTNTQTFYSATVTAGSVTLQPSLYTNDQTFFAATVAPGPVDLQPSLYTNDQAFYSPTVVVDGGPQTLLPDVYVNTQTFFSLTVTQIAPQPENVFDADIGPRVRRKRKQREFDDERQARKELRETIKAAIEPVKDAAQATVLASQQDAEAGVAVVAAGETVSIPVPPEFNAAQVAQMVAAELERRNVAVRREAARQALETMVAEEKARIRRRQLEDDEIMLFN